MSIQIIKPEIEPVRDDLSALRETVSAILRDVEERGDAAVRDYERRFDRFDPPSYRVEVSEAASAADELPSEVIEELDFAIAQVTKFAEAQRASLRDWEAEISPGMRAGQRVLPVRSAGCYAPAGRYPCLTSAVMTVVPAKVAGVQRIVACSPPGSNGRMNRGILYTLHRMGIHEIYCLGGAQAVAAMAFGTQSINAVDMVVGPGNQYVAEAKRQVFGTVGIDLIAGPSECLVLADDSGQADYIAADLIAQCEHDVRARGCLVTTSRRVAEATLAEIDRQLADRTTRETAGQSWRDHGMVALADSLEEAIAFADDYAPEHLEIHARDPERVLKRLHNYGSAFIGEETAEVYADKIAGPNHVLPTGRAARYTGGLWVGNFLKVITHMQTDPQASVRLARYAEVQSTYEGMDGHRYAAAIRRQKLSGRESGK